MVEIQRFMKDVARPTPEADYVWSYDAVVYSTAYHDVVKGTVAFTHKGCWVLTAEASGRRFDRMGVKK